MINLEQKIISDKRRTAFVGSGGGPKALAFHMGVGRCLEEKGFKFKGGVSDFPWANLRSPGKPGNKDIDLYVGSSIGSLYCAAMALGYSPEEIYQIFMDDKALRKVGLARGIQHYLSLNTQALTQLAKSVRRTFKNGWDLEAFSIMSPISLRKLEKRLHNFLGTENFQRLNADLFVVTTPLNSTGRIVYCRKPKQQDGRVTYRDDAKISSAVAASCSLQCFHPMNIEHRNGDKIDLVDGETRKTLSYRLAADNGADLVFVSYTHVPYHFDKVVGSIKKHGITKIITQSVYLMIHEKILASQELIKSKNRTLDILAEEFERIIREVPDQRKKLERCQDNIRGRFIQEFDIRPEVDYIFITPDENDADFFLTGHFSMSKDYIKRIADIGYQAAKRALGGYQFR